jgi:hypothetical protein
MRDTRRQVIIVLALVAAILIVAVVVKYWPPEVERGVRAWFGSLLDTSVGIWRRTSGRWATLTLAAIGVGVGLAVLRRQRSVGLIIIEVSIVGGAVIALLQPDGW